MAQGVQEVVTLAVFVQKVPTGPSSHCPPSGPLIPAVHLQFVID